MKYLIFNLKSNKTLEEMKSYEEEFKSFDSESELIICPSYPFYQCFRGSNYILGAQDVSAYPPGTYTGEVNAEQLSSLNVKYVIIGHSERRNYFKEDASLLKNKITRALANNLQVVYCIGENIEEYTEKKTKEVLKTQIESVLGSINRSEVEKIIIAYEPLWAISDGITPAPIPTEEEIEKVALFIKKLIKESYNADIEVLYGGSANDTNIDSLKSIASIEGLLVGGASLDTNKIKKMVESVNS